MEVCTSGAIAIAASVTTVKTCAKMMNSRRRPHTRLFVRMRSLIAPKIGCSSCATAPIIAAVPRWVPFCALGTIAATAEGSRIEQTRVKEMFAGTFASCCTLSQYVGSVSSANVGGRYLLRTKKNHNHSQSAALTNTPERYSMHLLIACGAA